MIKVIKTDQDYVESMRKFEGLLDGNPQEGTDERDQIELLKVLIKNYEDHSCPVETPDPIEAINFRLEQTGKSHRDLIPFIGNRSKVHEVLSRKRPLTLSMIRALQSGLGIPANVLINSTAPEDNDEPLVDEYPINEIVKRKWLENIKSPKDKNLQSAFDSFIAPFKTETQLVALCRKTKFRSADRKINKFALEAWIARVLQKTLANKPKVNFDPKTLDSEFLHDLVHLSSEKNGPFLAREFLRSSGISLIIEPHLKHTYLDGVSLNYQNSLPVIALTVRYDRIDNFWFTLFHELGHLKLHLIPKNNFLFIDDLDIEPIDIKEKEADDFANEALIPNSEWENSPASKSRMPEAAKHLATRLKIHPAIVAGRIQHKYKDYRSLKQLVGNKEVRYLFSDINWEQ